MNQLTGKVLNSKHGNYGGMNKSVPKRIFKRIVLQLVSSRKPAGELNCRAISSIFLGHK